MPHHIHENPNPKDVHVLPGEPAPLGATVRTDGVNFSLFSANATAVQLLLYDALDQRYPSRVITLDPTINKTYYYWHAHVQGIGDGQLYAYRVQGPYVPERGMMFNGHKVLLDPYARAVAYGENWSRAAAYGSEENGASALKSVVVDMEGYDWQGDAPLQRPMNETIIYETHVRGLTAHSSSGVSHPGTYAGLIEKIPYLRTLGVTAVELLPVHQFDPQEVQRQNPITRQPLSNYWGYASLGYFAPHLGYSSSGDARRTVDEFRDMVRALHRAGIEVLLDVVFNHTAEGDAAGPTICFRGLENIAYYMVDVKSGRLRNFTGCGNTINCNHSIVRRLICQCLRHWVREYHIDGFRFDLASVLSRNERGEPISDSPILWEIESDPELAGTKLIAEAWDAAGLYQVGGFTGDRWAEWNGRFRDDVRRFVRGDPGTVRDFAWRMTGSFDVFRNKPSYTSHRSINFVTCHDGFTMADLVSYNRRHNQANGDGNRDGASENFSWNCGIEGPTTNPKILRLRQRQSKNLIALLMAARGTPMILGGDEMGRTQDGNNNAYCQDNEISWYDWGLLHRNTDLYRFIRGMVNMRRQHPTLTVDRALGDRPFEEALLDGVEFHGVTLGQPDWAYHSHTLAMRLAGVEGDVDMYIIANAYKEALDFQLPQDVRWACAVDTNRQPPDDLVPEEEAPLVTTPALRVADHSVVILIARHG